MAVPDYLQRNAIAISQAVSGLDEQRLEEQLAKVCIGVTIGRDAGGHEGRAMGDLLIRLLARLYPSIVIGEEGTGGLTEKLSVLAGQVNPRIDLSGQPTIEVVIGQARPRWSDSRTLFAGSRGWSAMLSSRDSKDCGGTNNPFGAGMAACLAAADIFRYVFLPGAELDGNLECAVPNVGEFDNEDGNVNGNAGSVVLAGAGAIGNAAAWALSRTALEGLIDIVDHEAVDLGNLQRYVLAERDHQDRPKAPLVAERFNGKFCAAAHECRLAELLERKRHKVEMLLLALDTAKDRCAAQASLPRYIANAWTQPGDLGVSSHDFLKGACVKCLYLTDAEQKSEDQIIAESFGVPDQIMKIRILLHNNEGAPRELLEVIAAARNIPLAKLMHFEGRPLRTLYTEGFCGGAVIPLGEAGEPNNDVHVPLAHQSAMAGVLLAAVGVTMQLSKRADSVVAQYDVLKPQESLQVYPAAKDSKGRCICQDKDFLAVYRKKYSV